MPALMNSSVGSVAGMIEADPIRACCRSVKNRRKISRISLLPRGRFMPTSMLPARAPLASRFWPYSSTWPVTQVIVPPPTQIAPASSVEI